MELAALLTDPNLPDEALHAAAAHADLLYHLTRREQLPDELVRTLWDRYASRWEAAVNLVRHIRTGHLRHHVLHVRGERRSQILADLLRDTVPSARWRADNQDLLTGFAADAVLANPRWPIEEQAAVASRATVPAFFGWLENVAPGGGVDTAVRRAIVAQTAAPLPAPSPHTSQFEREMSWPTTSIIRNALARWPEAAPLAQRGAAWSSRAAVIPFIEDDAVLADLVEQALRCWDPTWGPALYEALWNHPALPTKLFRRLIAGRDHLSYSQHYAGKVARVADGFTVKSFADWTDADVDRVLAWALDGTDARHLSTWTVVALAGRRRLSGAQALSAARVFEAHGTAVGLTPATHAWLCKTIGDPVPVGVVQELRTTRRGRPRPRSTEEVGSTGAAPLIRAFGDDRAAWDVAIVLLRDGWPGTPEDLARTVASVNTPSIHHDEQAAA